MTYTEIQKLNKQGLLAEITRFAINYEIASDRLTKYHFKEMIRIYGQHLKRLAA